MEDGLSGGTIARQIGCTRSALIGKMFRMGIKSANAKGHQPGEPAPWKSKPKAPRPNKMTINARPARHHPFEPPRIPVEEPVEAPPEPPPNARTFDDLAAGECRWPYGDGTPYLFCAADVIDGKQYCGPHCRMAYQSTPGLIRQRARYEVAA